MNLKRKLQKIIDQNLDGAELGCPTCQGLIVMAQSELDDIANLGQLEWLAIAWDAKLTKKS